MSTKKYKVKSRYTPIVPASKTQVDRNQGVAIMKLKKDMTVVKSALSDRNQYTVGQSIATGTTASIGVLSGVAQGNGANQRIGTETTLTSLRFAFTVSPNASTNTDTMRIILFRWKGPLSGAAPSSSQILTTTNNVNSSFTQSQ